MRFHPFYCAIVGVGVMLTLMFARASAQSEVLFTPYAGGMSQEREIVIPDFPQADRNQFETHMMVTVCHICEQHHVVYVGGSIQCADISVSHICEWTATRNVTTEVRIVITGDGPVGYSWVLAGHNVLVLGAGYSEHWADLPGAAMASLTANDFWDTLTTTMESEVVSQLIIVLVGTSLAAMMIHWLLGIVGHALGIKSKDGAGAPGPKSSGKVWNVGDYDRAFGGGISGLGKKEIRGTTAKERASNNSPSNRSTSD